MKTTIPKNSVKLADVKPGDRLVCDTEYWPCTMPDHEYVVRGPNDHTGDMFINCDRGKHFLCCPDLDGFLIGMYRAED